jgi:hypothetical protein
MSKTDCVNIKTNEENCTCGSLDCDRHGVCCECLRAHTDKEGLPACLRTKIQESQQFRENITNLINKAAE